MGNDWKDPKKMDGPVVQKTVSDLFRSNSRLFIFYHAADAGYNFLTPLGAGSAGLAYLAGFKPYPTLPQTMGTGGLVGGSMGIVLGCALATKIAFNGEKSSPPWNDDGIQMRVDGLSHNFKVRVMENSVWSGAVIALCTTLFIRNPASFRLSAGPMGYLQAIGLGSALGSLAGLTCIGSNGL